MAALVGIEPYLQQAKTALEADKASKPSLIALRGSAGSGKTTVLENLTKDYDNSIVVKPTGQPYELVEKLVEPQKAKELLRKEGWNGYQVIFYTTDSGMVAYHAGESEQDPDVLGSMASAVRDFVKDSLARSKATTEETTKGGLDWEDGKVLYCEKAGGRVVGLVKGALTDAEGHELEYLAEIRKDLEYLAENIPKTGFDSNNYSGNQKDLPEAMKELLTQFSKKKYLVREKLEAEPDDAVKYKIYDVVLESLPADTILAVDGVEELDLGSLGLLSYISRAGANKNISVVAAYDKDVIEQKEQHKKFLEDLESKITVELLPLNDNQIKIVAQSYFSDPLDGETFLPLYEWLSIESKGNPRYANALVQKLIEENDSKQAHEKYWAMQTDGKIRAFKGLDQVLKPKNLEAITSERFETLTEQEQIALKYLSAARQIEQNILVDAISKDLPQENWDAIVTSLLWKDLAVKAGNKIAVSDSLLAEKARSYSTRRTNLLLGEALETFGGHERASELAKLFAAAHDEKTAKYAEISGDAAIDTKVAVEDYDLALEFVNEQEVKFRLLKKYNQKAFAVGEWGKAELRAKEHIELAKRMAPKDIIGAKLNLAEAYLLLRQDREASIELAKILGSKPEKHSRAEAFLLYSRLKRVSNKTEAAKNLAKKGLELSRDLNDDKLLATAYYILAAAETYTREFEEAEEHLNKSESILLKLKPSEDLTRVYNNLGFIYGLQKDFAKAVLYYEEAIKVGNQCGAAYVVSYAASNAAEIFSELGNIKELRKYAEIQMNAAQKAGELRILASAYSMFGDLAMFEKDNSGVNYYYSKSLTLGAKTGGEFLGILYQSYGNALYQLGDKANAIKAYIEAQKLFTSATSDQRAMEITLKIEEIKNSK